MWIRVAIVTTFVCACGPATVHDGNDTSSESTAVTAMLDATGPQGTGSDTVASTGTDSGADEAVDLPKFDVATKLDVGPVIETCAPSELQAVDLEVVTPDGPFAATYAWWAWDACCSTHPRLFLGEGPELEVQHHSVTTPHVVVHALGGPGDAGPFQGPLSINAGTGDNGFTEHETGFVLLEALDPEEPADGELPLFVGTFAIEAQGWTLSGSVSAPYCDFIAGPGCPCE